MKLLNVATVALNQTPFDWANNCRHIEAALVDARKSGATVVCLPELCITGYGCEDAFFSPDLQRRAFESLLEIATKTAGMIVSLGLPSVHNGALYNSVCLIADGKILGFVPKQHLAGDGVHYEPRWFKAWPAGEVSEITFDGKQYPFGDLLFECGGVKIGFEICEDAWTPQRPGINLAVRGADLILNPSASHFAFGKQETRRRLILEGSRAFCVTYLYANLLGNEAGRVIYDGSTMIATNGKMVAEGERFSYADYTLATAVIDVDITRSQRMRLTARQNYIPKTNREKRSIQTDFNFPNQQASVNETKLTAWETGEYLKEEEFARAIALGLFDYLRKSRCQQFVISLSGGADSAAVAVLVWLSIELGIRSIGKEAYLKKLGHIVSLQNGSTIKADIIHQLLICMYQATKNSSEETSCAAETLATRLDATFYNIDVDSLVDSYVKKISDLMGRKLNWRQDDITLQNIQARVRVPGIWMLANIGKGLLLATSNRSEAAVGYTTMDGDTSGSLAPIAGIDKAFLLHWLRWVEGTARGEDELSEIPRIPALAAINRQQPTAELRPQDKGQTDESDLMPYDLLDAIERAAIRDKQSPVEVYQVIQAEFPAYQNEQFAGWVRRFFQLWARNQWKRERYAPSFHLDDENLDPKTWCRFPILSGGFEAELDLLEKETDDVV